MSSALQSALTSVQQFDYVTVAILTAVGYDYVLTFSREIEYVWGKPWTWVTMLFILVRYAGLCTIIFSCLCIIPLGRGLLTNKLTGVCTYRRGIFNLISAWTFLLFLVAADVVMILRVWAMYNRSRLILGALLASFSLEIIFNILGTVIIYAPKNLSAVTIRILNFSLCTEKDASPISLRLAAISAITHGAVMCILAIVQFARQSFQMYRVTKQWQVNQYMNLLIKHGIIYYLFVFLLALVTVLGTLGKLPPGGWQAMLSVILQYVPLYTLTPRFIINIRELYARDVQGRCGEGIDTGFGLSLPDRGIVETAIVFADVGQNEDVEEIPTDVGMAQAV